MPVPLPPPLRIPLVTRQSNLDHPPSDPPTAFDVVQAMRYAKAIVTVYDLDGPQVTTEDVSAALEYQAAVIAAKNPAGAAPPWFAAAMTQMNARFDQQDAAIDQQRTAIAAINTRLNQQHAMINVINTKLDEQHNTIQGMQVEMGRFGDLLGKIDHRSSILYNKTCANGSIISFQEVPFPDGTYPTQAPHNLPAIESLEVLKAMQRRHIKKYHQNYCPERQDVDGRLDDAIRINEILKRIGCCT